MTLREQIAHKLLFECCESECDICPPITPCLEQLAIVDSIIKDFESAGWKSPEALALIKDRMKLLTESEIDDAVYASGCGYLETSGQIIGKSVSQRQLDACLKALEG